MRCRTSATHSHRLLGLCLLSVLCMILLAPNPAVAESASDNLIGVKVAVYNGTGEMNSSRIALMRMFEWMDATVVEVNASQILGDFLDECDILVFPGGSESSYMIDLQYLTGIEKIQDFVENGGSYFGICGGSTFGARTLDLFDGNMYSVNEPGDTIHMSTMNVNQSSTGPDLSDYSANFTTMYYASQFFVPRVRNDVHVVARYDSNNQPGMIAFEYGNGTVFLSSPHPEYEEDSDRDDTTFGDDLDDPDSEWDLLLRVSKWLVEASIVETVSTTITSTTTTTNTTTTAAPLDLPLIAVATTGGAIVVLASVALYRRLHE